MAGFVLGTSEARACEPAAFDYLRKHGLSTDYKDWTVVQDSIEHEELLVTATTVIWTRGTVLKRALDFAADKQDVVHALFVCFPAPNSDLIASFIPEAPEGYKQSRFASTRNAFKSTAHSRYIPQPVNKQDAQERALVVLLEEIAYIYYDDGRRDVIHMPFRVKCAFPTKTGLILEREVDLTFVTKQALPTLFFLPRPLDELGVITAKDNRWTVADTVLYVGHGLLVSTNLSTSSTTLWSLDFLNERASEASLHSSRLSHARRRSSFLRPGLPLASDDLGMSRPDSTMHSDRVVFSDMDPTLLFNEAESLRNDAVLEPITIVPVAASHSLPRVIVLQERETQIVMIHAENESVLSLVLKRSSSGRFVVSKTDKTRAKQMMRVENKALLVQFEASYIHTPLGLRVRLDTQDCGHLLQSRGVTVWSCNPAGLSKRTLNTTVCPIVDKLLAALRIVMSRQHYEQLYFAILHAQRNSDSLFAFRSTMFACFLQPCTPDTVDPALQAHLSCFDGCDLSFAKLYYSQIILAIHFVHQELALDILSAPHAAKLIPILLQLSSWARWPVYVHFYAEQLGEACEVDDGIQTHINVAAPTESPPSLFFWIEERARGSRLPFQGIESLSSHRDLNTRRHQQPSICPITNSLLLVYDSLYSSSKTLEQAIEAMEGNLTLDQIERLPQPFSVPLRDAIAACSASPSMKWRPDLLKFVGRHDLANFFNQPQTGPTLLSASNEIKTISEASRSEANLPMPVESTTNTDLRRLIWPADLRLAELERMLCYSEPVIVQMLENVNLGEADLVKLQQMVARGVAKRTLASPVGFGILQFDSTDPMPTELFAHRKINLDVKFKPANITVAEDTDYLTAQFKVWGEFHGGCADGLSISKKAQGVSASWIVYNKPKDLTDKHAGFLLGLGLNGHLKAMATWHAFNYLTSKHTTTSIGLLLGMSASFLGTMDAMITKLLSVHLLALLPPGANDLNLSGQTQAAGLMGIGLLHFDSMHRRMTEVMCGEICGRDMSENHFRDESYRLSAGLSLGFINVGRGHELKSLSDMQMSSKLVACVHGIKREKHDLDVKIPGAIMALGLLYLQTDDKDIASALAAPHTEHDLESVRPNILMLRVLASSLIRWDSITPTADFVSSQLPHMLRSRSLLETRQRLDSDDMALYNMIAGACLAIGIRFAGKQHAAAIDVLLGYLDKFLPLSQLPDHNHDQKACKIAVRNCLGVLCLASSLVAAGSGNLNVMRRLRVVHFKTNMDITYGAFLAVQMSLGFLFMGGGRYTLASTKLATASLVAACYPILPNAVTDNGVHLQALRHLWVLAAEPRCIIPRDTQTRAITSLPLQLTMKDGSNMNLNAPCLLPPLESIRGVNSMSKLVLPVTLDFADDGGKGGHLTAFKQNQTVWITRHTDQSDEDAIDGIDEAMVELQKSRLAPINALVSDLVTRQNPLSLSIAAMLTEQASEEHANAFVARAVSSRTTGARQLQGLDLIATYMHVTKHGRLKDKFAGCRSRLLSEEESDMLGLRLWQARRRN